MRIRYAAACLAACAALALGAARAEWYVFETDKPPEALLDAAMQVSGFSGEVMLSFLGDCTLGGESKAANSRGGFVQTALRDAVFYSQALSGALLPSLADDLQRLAARVPCDRLLQLYDFCGTLSRRAETNAAAAIQCAGLCAGAYQICFPS